MKWLSWVALAVGLSSVVGFLSFNAGRGSRTAEEIVIPPSKSFFVHGEAPSRTLIFSGSWELEGTEKTAFQKEIIEYRCEEAESSCRSASAMVYQNILSMGSGWQDARWASDRVILTEASAMNCRNFTVIADLLTQEVTGIATDTPNRAATCSALPALTVPRKSRMVDGFKRTIDEQFR